jgi:hypothetical protein
MLSASECRKNAGDCRELVPLMTRPEDKAALEKMAQTWEQLAAEAERKACA